MNNKGFTLIELLAVIVILSLIGVISYTSVLNYIDTTKIKAEEKFLNEISNEIESYLGLYGGTNFKKVGREIEFYKNVTNINSVKVKAYKLVLKDGNNFTLKTLIDTLKTTDKFQNPRTEKICDEDRINIEVYRDSDYVYYYYVNMTDPNIGCTALNDIDTRSDKLKCSLGISGAC